MFRYYRFFLLIVLSILWQSIFAQKPPEPNFQKYKVARKKAEAYNQYCYSLFNYISASGKFIDFSDLIKVCKRGLNATQRSDFKNLYRLEYLTGLTYKIQLNYDSAFFYLKKSIGSAQRGNDIGNEVAAIRQINYLYRYTGRFAEMNRYNKRLIALQTSVKDIAIKDELLSALSEYYLYNGDYEQAIETSLNSLSTKEYFYQKKKDHKSQIDLGLALSNLGSLYLDLNQNQSAINYLKRSEPYFAQYTGGRVRMSINLEKAYLNIDRTDSAMFYYRKIYKAMVKDYFYEAAPLSAANRLFGEYHLKKKEMNLANKYTMDAYSLAITSESKETILLATTLMGHLLYEQKKHAKSVYYLEQALPNSYNFNKDIFAGILLKLAQNYQQLNNHQKAYQFFNKYNLIRDSIYFAKSREGINAIEFKYKNAEKEQRIKFLNAQSDAQNKEIKQQRQYQIILIICVFLALLISILFYRIYINKKKANLLLDKKNQQLDIINNQLDQANQTKTKLFSIISHDLRSPVSQLFTYLRLQQNTVYVSIDEKEKNQEKLMQSSKNLLATMEDLLLWSKSQMENFQLEIDAIDITLLFEQSIALMTSQADAKNLTLEIAKTGFGVIECDENFLIIIIRNLLQNAINHSHQNGNIGLNAGFDGEGKKYLSVSNNGDEIPPSKIAELLNQNDVGSKSSGYGLLIVRELSLKLNAKVGIVSTPKITEVSITFQ